MPKDPRVTSHWQAGYQGLLLSICSSTGASADMNIRTKTGNVDLKRLAGGQAAVTVTDGGSHNEIRLGVLQCGSAEIDSGGGDVHIKQIAIAPDPKEPGGWSGSGMNVRNSSCQTA